MAIQLTKGQKINLSKEVDSLKRLQVNLTWKEQTRVGEDFDLDVLACMLGGNTPKDTDLIFYNNLSHQTGALTHHGDDRKGNNGETLDVDFSKITNDYDKIVFIIAIHEAEARKQNFGQVRDASVEIVDMETNKIVATYDLSEDYCLESCVVPCEIYLHGGDWRFKADGSGYTSLVNLLKDYNYNV